MSKTRVLTGITTSGTPHLGNYVGAIKPAIEASQDPSVQSFYFLADYHALIKLSTCAIATQHKWDWLVVTAVKCQCVFTVFAFLLNPLAFHPL